jgi:hypothetical protein
LNLSGAAYNQVLALSSLVTQASMMFLANIERL